MYVNQLSGYSDNQSRGLGDIWDTLLETGAKLYVADRNKDAAEEAAAASRVQALALTNRQVAATPIAPKNNTWLYVGIGVGGLAVLGLATWFFVRK